MTSLYGPQAITWTNFEFLLVRFFGIHPRGIFAASALATVLYNDLENCIF